MAATTSNAKVYWTEKETAQVMTRARELIGARDGLSPTEIMRRAQGILPETRWKTIASASVKRFMGSVLGKEAAQARQMELRREASSAAVTVVGPEQPADEYPPITAPQPADEYPPITAPQPAYDSLTAAITTLKHAITECAITAIVQAVEEASMLIEAGDVAVRVPRKKRQVLVAGMLAVQAQEVQREFGDCFELRFWTKDDSPSVLKSLARTSGVSLCMTDFFPHTLEAILKNESPNYRRVTGGVSSIKQALTELRNGR